jgi:D-alanyl-D-alanine carboxypeptidase
MTRHHVPGLSLAVIRGGTMLKSTGYGLADLERNTPVHPSSTFEIGSIAKTITATAVLALVEHRRLGLFDRIADHLAGLPSRWKDVTVYQLLSHTSGIKSYTDAPDFRRIASAQFAPDEIVRMVARSPLRFEPGTGWRYGNTGYYLLGLLIERISGTSYWEHLESGMFARAGMVATHSTAYGSAPRRAVGYSWRTTLRHPQYSIEHGVTETAAFSAGGLMSNAEDLCRWITAFAAGELVGLEWVRLMWTPAHVSSVRQQAVPYGLGWFVSRFSGHRVAWHGGGSPGFSTQLMHFPDQALSVILLANRYGFDTFAFAREIAAFFIRGLDWHDERGREDPEPRLTRRVRQALSGFCAGNPKATLFAPEAGALLASGSQRAIAKTLRGRGAVKSLRYVGRGRLHACRIQRYRLVDETGSRLLTCLFDRSGRIMGLRADDIDP